MRIVSGVSVMLAVAALGFAIWQASKLGRLRVAVAGARAGWQGRLEKLEQRIAELEARATSAGSPAGSTTVAGGEATAAEIERRQQQRLTAERRAQQELARRRAREAKERALALKEFRFSPEIQQWRFRQFAAELDARYRPLYRALGLSPEQVARFEQLMAERYWAYADVLATRGTAADGLDEPAFAELKQRALAPFDEGLRALLGDAGAEHYRRYERTVNAQELVQDIAGRLFDTTEPLTAAQADRLLVILADHKKHRGGDVLPPDDSWLLSRVDGRDPTAPVQWTDIDWNVAPTKLGEVLSAHQLAVVQSLRDQADARRQIKFLQDEFAQELRLKSEKKAAAPSR